jgi:hypothetical protein
LPGGARNLGQAGGLVQFWKLSPGGRIWFLFERILGATVLTGKVAAPRWLQFFVIKILAVLSFLESKVIIK